MAQKPEHLAKRIIMNTKIESRTVTIQKSATEIFEFLSDARNFEKLMPEGVTKFEADADAFLFKLGSLPEVKLKISERVANERIVLSSAGGPIAFNLIGEWKAQNESGTEGKLMFEGDFNPMLKMMVQKPLTSFIEKLADNLEKL